MDEPSEATANKHAHLFKRICECDIGTAHYQEPHPPVAETPEPQCVPLCGASKAYGHHVKWWQHEQQCPARVEKFSGETSSIGYGSLTNEPKNTKPCPDDCWWDRENSRYQHMPNCPNYATGIAPKPTTKVCPTCDGKGKVDVVAQNPVDAQKWNGFPCLTCNGTGVAPIDATKGEWILPRGCCKDFPCPTCQPVKLPSQEPEHCKCFIKGNLLFTYECSIHGEAEPQSAAEEDIKCSFCGNSLRLGWHGHGYCAEAVALNNYNIKENDDGTISPINPSKPSQFVTKPLMAEGELDMARFAPPITQRERDCYQNGYNAHLAETIRSEPTSLEGGGLDQDTTDPEAIAALELDAKPFDARVHSPEMIARIRAESHQQGYDEGYKAGQESQRALMRIKFFTVEDYEAAKAEAVKQGQIDENRAHRLHIADGSALATHLDYRLKQLTKELQDEESAA